MHGCDGRSMEKILMTTIQVNLCVFLQELAPNSPELSSLFFCHWPIASLTDHSCKAGGQRMSLLLFLVMVIKMYSICHRYHYHFTRIL